MTTGKLLITLQIGSPVNAVALSADGTIALTGTDDKKALVWDAKSGALLNTLLTDVYANSVALSKDGKRALTLTNNGKIQVWNTKPLPGQNITNKPLTVLEGPTRLIEPLAFGSNDFIASGSYDRTALIWKPFALEPRGLKRIKKFLGRPIRKLFLGQNFFFKKKNKRI